MPRILTMCLLALALPGGAPEAVRQGPVRVFVEPMGEDHEAFHFRKLLVDHLARGGIAITLERSGADAVLGTTLSTPVIGGETRAFATADLHAKDGRRLWTADFPANTGWRQTRGRDAVAQVAEEIAEAVQRGPLPPDRR